MGNMTEKEWKEWLKNTTDEDLNESLQRVSKKEFDQENPNWEKDKAIMKAEKQRRRRAKNKAKPMGKKYGGHVKSSAETSVIKGARAKGSAQGSTIPGAPAKGSAEGSTIPMTPMKMKHGGDTKKGSMLSITIEKKPIDKKTMNMIKKAEQTDNVVKMKSGGLAKRGYGKARR